MITLIKILIFGGASLLTPKSIDLVDATTLIPLAEPISAITEAASLEIDVSQYVNTESEDNAVQAFSDAFPNACVSAMLHSKFGVSVYLDKVEGRVENNKKLLRLSASTGMEAGVNFNRLEIHACKEIRRTTLIWHNYDKPSFLP
ncbi:hypothetical protein [Zhongshania sp.]|uniref:hypothetical protein n=1 Tax=Zhongshania sp. TaxID=1971902 RepID=UPI003566021A